MSFESLAAGVYAALSEPLGSQATYTDPATGVETAINLLWDPQRVDGRSAGWADSVVEQVEALVPVTQIADPAVDGLVSRGGSVWVIVTRQLLAGSTWRLTLTASDVQSRGCEARSVRR